MSQSSQSSLAKCATLRDKNFRNELNLDVREAIYQILNERFEIIRPTYKNRPPEDYWNENYLHKYQVFVLFVNETSNWFVSDADNKLYGDYNTSDTHKIQYEGIGYYPVSLAVIEGDFEVQDTATCHLYEREDYHDAYKDKGELTVTTKRHSRICPIIHLITTRIGYECMGYAKKLLRQIFFNYRTLFPNLQPTLSRIYAISHLPKNNFVHKAMSNFDERFAYAVSNEINNNNRLKMRLDSTTFYEEMGFENEKKKWCNPDERADELDLYIPEPQKFAWLTLNKFLKVSVFQTHLCKLQLTRVLSLQSDSIVQVKYTSNIARSCEKKIDSNEVGCWYGYNKVWEWMKLEIDVLQILSKTTRKYCYANINKPFTLASAGLREIKMDTKNNYDGNVYKVPTVNIQPQFQQQSYSTNGLCVFLAVAMGANLLNQPESVKMIRLLNDRSFDNSTLE